MNFFRCPSALLAPLFLGATLAAGPFGTPPDAVQRLALDSGQAIFEEKDLWVRGAAVTVNPGLQDPIGINAMVSPPFAAQLRIGFKVNHQTVPLEAYQWRVGELERSGTAGAVRVETLLVAAAEGRGALLQVRLTPAGAAPGAALVECEVEPPRLLQTRSWAWDRPRPKKKAGLEEGPEAGPMIFSNGFGTLALATDLPAVARAGRKWTCSLPLQGGASAAFQVALALGARDEAPREALRLLAQPREQLARSRAYWNAQIEGLYQRLPRLRSDQRSLEAFYERSLLSIPLARWDLPGLLLSPYYPTSGLDGGAFCAYIWDYAYAAQINPLTDPAAARAHLVQFLRSRPMEHYAFSPFDGTGIGPRYAYNPYALIRGIYYYVLYSGDLGFLDEKVDGQSVLAHVVALALAQDDPGRPAGLIDFGGNENLLELHRTQAYTGYVPSPNAERCWSYRAVDRLAAAAGKPSPQLSGRADQLAATLRSRLWSEELGWFRTLDHRQRPRVCYSIQVFDLLRLDVLDAGQQTALLRHLNDREFLSPFGVHSLSKLDPGYDPADIDWGGPGVYTGDAPELIQDLYQSGHPGPAGDLLRRILWWGERMPYWPQAMCAGTMDYRRDGRCNLQSGICGAQALIFGLLGLEVTWEGTVSLRPNLPPGTRTLTFEGVRIRNRRFDASLDAKGCTVVLADGARRWTPLGQRLSLPP